MEKLSGQFLNISFKGNRPKLLPVSAELQQQVQATQQSLDQALEDPKVRKRVEASKVNGNAIERSHISVVIAIIGALGVVIAGFLTSPWVKDIFVSSTVVPSITAFPITTQLTENALRISTSTVENSPTATPAITLMSTSKDGMELILIPAGEFTMGVVGGNPDELPIHEVYLDAFLIDKTEVTNAMYQACVVVGVCEEPDNTSISNNASTGDVYYSNAYFDNYPVIHVNWKMAQTYCKWVGRRLPTEAEWEKAARWNDVNQTSRKYPWGSKIDCSYANYRDGNELCVGDTVEVGSYPSGASYYGVLDMAGNVREWVFDKYDSTYYLKSPKSNPTGPLSGSNRVIRGGSFLTAQEIGTPSGDRDFRPPDFVSHNIGFRCAMDAE